MPVLSRPPRALFLAVPAALALAAAVWAAPAAPALAQASQRIAAVVNDDVVSVYDVNRRMDMAIASARLADTPDTRNRILGQVVQQLVDERLKLQEAARLKINITQADIENGKRQVERNNGMQAGGLDQALRGMGVPVEVFEQQLKADVAWVKVVQTSLRRQVQVEPEEVDAVLDQLKRVQGKPQSLVAEIQLPVNTPEDDDKVRQFAQQMVEKLGQGANFQALARQFSAAPTAAVGGDLGWVTEGQLDPEVEDVIARLGKGQISPPVRTTTGWGVFAVRDRRVPTPVPTEQMPATLSQLFMPLSGPKAVPADKRAELANTLSAPEATCEDVDRIAQQMGLPSSGPVGTVRPADLPPAVRAVVASAPVGKIAGPVSIGGAEVLVMVCARQDPNGLPSRDQIEARISGEKLERVAQRALRDLRRRAVIDVRL